MLIVCFNLIYKVNKDDHTYVIDLDFTANDTEQFHQIHNKYFYTRNFLFACFKFFILRVFYHSKVWVKRIAVFFRKYFVFVITHLWHKVHMVNNYYFF